MEKRPDENGGFLKIRDTANMLFVLSMGYSACLWPFLRHGFGREGIGTSGLVGFFILVLAAGFTNSAPLYNYLIVWIVLVVIHRARSFRTWKRGIIVHSRFNGEPWMLKLPFIRRTTTAKAVEVLLTFAAGALLLPLSKHLGLFVMGGAFALLMVRGFESEMNRKRIQQMHDARIDASWDTARFKGQTNEY